jgi:hypothetical protein
MAARQNDLRLYLDVIPDPSKVGFVPLTLLIINAFLHSLTRPSDLS